jgi:hypothetical protein
MQRSRHRLSIDATCGVAEVWVWDRHALAAYRLIGGQSQRVEASLEVEGFPFTVAVEVISQKHMDDDNPFREAIGRNRACRPLRRPIDSR